jgi:fibro-slime domain-containing protein
LVLAAGLACAGVRAGDGTSGAGASTPTGGTGASAPTGAGGAAGAPTASGAGGDDTNCAHEVHAVIRDFRGFTVTADQPKHPDFEYMVNPDPGIVARTLGADSKPVYAGGTTGTTHNQMLFDQWYRDVDGVNMKFEITIPLVPDVSRQNVFVYDSDLFFPIDNMGWGNQYQDHNFDFTTEIHFNFPYRGGEVFNFRGDDDVFIFVNGQLAVDLGGVHIAEMGSADLDAMAGALGITPGNSYRIDMFHAERHTSSSTFHLETTLSCIDNVIVP